jgi:hypothetical protein
MTSPSELPSSGREREIFLAALRRMSAECEAPDLLPDCPFAEPTATGAMGCLEECMDLLAEHGSPTATGEVLLPGLMAHRRPARARRGPGATVKPFDAQEMYLEDCGRPVLSEWRTASLVHRLSQLVSLDSDRTLDSVDRELNVRLVMAELDRRGLDAELLVRRGFALLISVAVGMAAIAAGTIDELPPDGEVAAIEIGKRWLPLLEAPMERSVADDLEEGLRQIFGGPFQNHALGWVAAAPLEDVLSLEPPTASVFGTFDRPAEDNDAVVSRWIADRFSATYPDTWATSSLHLEWQYLHARRIAPCPGETMKERIVDAAALARTIAERTTAAGDQEMRTTLLVRPAVEYLHAGNCGAAAALFDAARTINPRDAQAHNNYGFCMIPLDPDRALVAFEIAEKLAERSELVPLANRLFVYALTGRNASALALLEDRIDSWAEYRDQGAYLWSFDTDPPFQLAQVDSAKAYILDLAVLIAQETGLPQLVDEWERRRQELAC